MSQIIGVRFKQVGKVYYFNPCGIQTKVGQHVIVETARGVEYGVVALANRDVAEGEVVKPLKRLIRTATASDEKVVQTNKKRAEEAFHICEQKIVEHHLSMKLVSVEYTFDLSKVLFYFTADGRVDFRELVKDLASVFRTRIELRQIGVRDEAKVLGGLGICGRPLCCASFMEDFQPVSINMAKQQNLSLNPTKISGTCGRLMCCLKYEQVAYEELQRVTPRLESTVRTPDGTGVVLDANLLRGTCLVKLDDDENEPRVYKCADLQVLQAGRKQRRPHGAAVRTPLRTRPAVKPVEPLPELLPEIPARQERKDDGKSERRRSDRSRRRRRSSEPQADKPQEREQQPRRQEKKRTDNRQKDAQKERRPERREGNGFVDAHRTPRRRRPRRRSANRDGVKKDTTE